MKTTPAVWAVFIALVLSSGCNLIRGNPRTHLPIRLSTFSAPRQHGVTDIFVYSPWVAGTYAQLTLPEHCWGVNLPNTSHDSQIPVGSPWVISADSTKARLERTPRPGVIFRATAATDSMAVRLAIEIENRSDLPVDSIRALVCFKPDVIINTPSRADCMFEFRDTSYELTYFRSGGKRVKLHDQTTFHGDYPPRVNESNVRYKIVWGINVEGRPDIRSVQDVGWWYLGNHPGRIVEEKADPALIAIQARGDSTRWIGLIWDPPAVLFCNPLNPCFHSDPSFQDCPPGQTSRADGILLFHEGTFDQLVERALVWKARKGGGSVRN